MTAERGGWYEGREKGSRVLQSHGEKEEEWMIWVVSERDRSRDRPTVASRNQVTKTKKRKGRRAWARVTQGMAFGTVSSSFPTEGGPNHTWDTSDQYAARRFPSTGCRRLQDFSTSCSLGQPDRAKWHRGMRGLGGTLHGGEQRKGRSG
jgi:hypothetical protein